MNGDQDRLQQPPDTERDLIDSGNGWFVKTLEPCCVSLLLFLCFHGEARSFLMCFNIISIFVRTCLDVCCDSSIQPALAAITADLCLNSNGQIINFI